MRHLLLAAEVSEIGGFSLVSTLIISGPAVSAYTNDWACEN